MLKIYNTINRKKEEFKPINENEVGLYYCGPTVYWTQHIGNLRGATCADFIVRSLGYIGYKVKFVRNYTDVGHLTSDSDAGEDKMEKAAKRESLDPVAIADKYIDIYEEDAMELNLVKPSVKPRATEYISEMIDMVRILIDKGFAYTTELAVYFDVSKMENYTRLSGQVLEDNISGAGLGDAEDKNKKSPHDFALWFFRAGAHAKAIQFWPSSFESSLVRNGEGFPGWHIECSAMSKKNLGDTIDFHLGGIEHIPVHHTNEIAQSESANGVSFVNYWLHNEHLLVDGKKMAKSEGTSYSLADIKEKGFQPLALRYLFLQAHYRSKLNFTWESITAAQSGFNNLCDKVSNLSRDGEGAISEEYKKKFVNAIDDDFNTPEALAVAHELLKSELRDVDKRATILDFDSILGLNLEYCNKKEIDAIMTKRINGLIREREMARFSKDWKKADEIRGELDKLGVKLEDSDEGTKWSV